MDDQDEIEDGRLQRELKELFDELIDQHEEQMETLLQLYSHPFEMQVDLDDLTSEEKNRYYNFAIAYQAIRKGETGEDYNIASILLAMSEMGPLIVRMRIVRSRN